MKISVKNMVCNRCIKVITEELQKNNIPFDYVDLGFIYFKEAVSSNLKEKIIPILQKEGFELVERKELKIIHKIKSLIIDNIHYSQGKGIQQNFSDYLSLKIGIDYSYLSKLFSEIEKETIEHYIIKQRIEKAKELLVYNELTLSEISYELNYSSPQHLSRQFKQITGLTPTQFKKIGKRKKLDSV